MPLLRALVVAFPLLLVLAKAEQLRAQTLDSIEIANYAEPTEYEIGAVEVTGATFSDATAIKSIAGLKVGERVRIPGPEITRAVKALMRLRLFTDVQVKLTKTVDDIAFLELAIEEQPRLSRYRYKGLKKKYHDDLNDRLDGVLTKGGIVNENLKRNASNKIKEFFEEKGYLDTKVAISERVDSIRANAVVLTLDVDRGPRVKIEELDFVGNQEVKDRKLRGLMKETRRKRRIFSSSKFLPELYAEDKDKLIDYYNTIGFRDARITADSVTRTEEGDLAIKIFLEEGNRYFFRDITFKGNIIYSDKQLREVLGIKRGDVYNKDLLEQRLSFSQDGRDISSLYLDDGYLFFNVDPIETAVQGDSIDLEIRLNEGPQATVDQVVIRGNDRTHEHVIRRELRVRPGDKFSRADLIRSQREIIALGFFNPETLGINTPVNAERGTVDIEFDVEEKANDQLELSMGWGGSGFGLFGTVGVSFNNFSLRKAIEGGAWRPYPTGDAQRLSVRMQSNGRFFFSSTLSFSEPWLGGKRPTSLTTALNYNRISNGFARGTDNFGNFEIYTASANVGTRLRWPDDNFLVSGGLRVQHYELDNFNRAVFSTDQGQAVRDGAYTNVALEATIARTSIADPIFPLNGSKFSLSMRFTPPYSLLGRDVDPSASVQDQYRWVEYHRYRANVEWYKALVGKLVVKTSAKMGFLAAYNPELGISPFERFELGGAGINNSQLSRYTGTEIISSRGYEPTDFQNNRLPGFNDPVPTSIFNKLSVELRYPISLNPNATFFVLGFVEGANSWRNFKDYNPFDLKRSAGGGVRVFLPMFGTLGFDYGIGFDKINPDGSIGPQKGVGLEQFGQMNIILGFEPE